MARRNARAFEYRAGVRVRGSVLACDTAAGSDLIFLSHVHALDGRSVRQLRRPRGGRRQLLTTELTLSLLGSHAERLRPLALVAGYGRPFALGGLRVELFPSGHRPGAASLLCEHAGRRIVYAGAVRARPASARAGWPSHEVRTADALCVDATFGDPRLSFLDPAEALDRLVGFAKDALAAGATPVIFLDPLGTALDLAAALDGAGVPVRAHRSIVAAAGAWRHAGLTAPPVVRFAPQPAATGHAVLWPVDERRAPILGTLPSARIALASPLACDPAAVAELRADVALPLADRLDYAGLLKYIEATGAEEVALVGPPDGELATALAARGIDAYPVGPPRQIELFAA